ncbi:hypothetical protein VTK26DRAFT_221 [Humicola hyalothermophila]
MQPQSGGTLDLYQHHGSLLSLISEQTSSLPNKHTNFMHERDTGEGKRMNSRTRVQLLIGLLEPSDIVKPVMLKENEGVEIKKEIRKRPVRFLIPRPANASRPESLAVFLSQLFPQIRSMTKTPNVPVSMMILMSLCFHHSIPEGRGKNSPSAANVR